MSTPDRYNEELFLGYLEGDLTPEQIAEFEKLLAEDARLRNLVAQLVLDRHRLRKLPDEEAPVEVMDAVDRAMERRMLLGATPQAETTHTGVRRMRTGRLLVYSGIAAMFVLVAGLIARTLLDQPIIDMAGDTQKQNGQIAMRSDAPEEPATSPSENAARETLAMSSKGRIGDDAGDARPTQASKEGHVTPQTFVAPGASPGLARPMSDHAGSHGNTDSATSAMRAAKRGKTEEPFKSGEAQPAATDAPPAGMAATGARAAEKIAVKPSAVDGRQAGDRFRNADVPITPMAQDELERLESGGRVELATSSPESATADVVTWAQQHNVRIVSSSAEHGVGMKRASDVAAGKKDRENTDALAKNQAVASDVDAVTRDENASVSRELVLVLSQKQVDELVTHLNAQQKHVATHLDAPAERTEVQAEKEKIASKDEVKADSKELHSSKAASETRTVGAAGEPASTPTPAAPAAPLAAGKSAAVVRLSVVISPAAATAATAKPTPTTAPASKVQPEASESTAN